MRHWWFSCRSFTCYVQSGAEDLITNKSAPIVRRFTGQHLKNLVYWMKKIGGFRYYEYK